MIRKDRASNIMGEKEQTLKFRLESAIKRIQGVVSTKVILNGQNDVLEVHLVAFSSRRPKQIVRDIESLLCARFGIRIDYRRISIAQLGAKVTSPVDTRLLFVSARPHPDQANCVQVVLKADKSRYEGTAPIHPQMDTESRVRAAVEATLFALAQFTGGIIPLKAEGAHITSANGNRVCLAVIAATTSQGEETLTGTCVIKDSFLEAASKASLDAINRRLPIWATIGEGKIGVSKPKGSGSPDPTLPAPR